MADEAPKTTDHNPAGDMPAVIDRVLALAATWTHWDGRPIVADDREHTPHKAVRRTADHLLDHLAEVETRMAGVKPLADHWHASAVTTPADLAPFTEADLDEARSRLTRLAQLWAVRIGSMSRDQLDYSPGAGWTFRQLAVHLDDTYHADAVGDLSG